MTSYSSNLLLKSLFIAVLLSVSYSQLCEDTRCIDCKANPLICAVCSPGYKPDLKGACTTCDVGYGPISPYNKKCVPCLDSDCSTCTENYKTCLKCKSSTSQPLNGKCVTSPQSVSIIEGCDYGKTADECDQTRCQTSRTYSFDSSKMMGSCTCQSDLGYISKPDPVAPTRMTCTACETLNCARCSYNDVLKVETCLNASGEPQCDIGYKPALIDKTKPVACDSCAINYGKDLTNQAGLVCKPCSVANCAQCTADRASCDTCKDGFTLDLSKTKCLQSCQLGNGYDSTLTKCEPCTVAGCGDCGASSAKCTTCLSGFQVSATGGCDPMCINAGEGFDIQSGQCLKCADPGCQSCTSDFSLGKCDTCSVGYTKNTKTGICDPVCPDPAQGFDAKSQKCLPCTVKDCLCTADYSTCKVCRTGFNFDVDVCAAKCPLDLQGFDTSSANATAPVCTACAAGDFCTKCTGDFTKCEVCKPGYKVNLSFKCELACPGANLGFDSTATAVPPCKACSVANCASCNTDYTQCSACLPGYKMDTTSNTPACVPSCVEPGLGYNQAFKPGGIASECIACAVKSCGDCQFDASVCKKCSPGFGMELTSKLCQPCKVANCGDCLDNNVACAKCLDTFTKNTVSGACECAAKTGLVLDSTPAKCAACADANCSLCMADSRTCTLCADKTGFNANKACTTCSDPNCALCSADNTACTRCTTGFTFDTTQKKCVPAAVCTTPRTGLSVDGVCIACSDQFCEKCFDNNTVCSACQTDYVLKPDATNPKLLTCQKNTCSVPNCAVCNVATAASTSLTCKTCQPGFVVNALGLCECNIINCKACSATDPTKVLCDYCHSGFIQNADATKCDPQCLPSCKLCSGTTCTQCETGLRLGNLNGQPICYKPVSDVDSTPDATTNILPGCVQLSINDKGAIMCQQCLSNKTDYCLEGDQKLTKDLLKFYSKCVPKYSIVPCEMKGCLKCSLRQLSDTTDTTCAKQGMQCNYADDVNGFILAKLGADQISVLKDLTKYDNILMKSPIANCQTLTLMTSSSSNIPTLTCQQCIDRYVVTSEGQCAPDQCYTKYLNCRSCTSTAGCSQCAIGFDLVNSECKPSVLDCSTLEGCTTCAKDTASATGALLCQACKDGYTLSAGVCQICTTCSANQYFDPVTNTYLPCNANCATCQNGKECSTCAAGFLNPPLCNQCEKPDLTFDTTQMVCIPLCFPPKIFDITTKACKDNTVKNCIKYSTTTNGSMTCVACATGFALGKLNGSVDFQCVQCSISCAQCKFALDNTNQYQEYCGQCADGYVFDSTGKCVAKDATTVPSVCAPTTFPLPKCTTCVFKGTSPVCTACETGFRLSGFGTCIKDCTDATNPYNFNYYDESTQSCGSCAPSNCLQGCFQVQSATGYIVNCADNLCQSGYEMVLGVCTQKTTQLDCGLGKYGDTATTCAPCPTGCTQCTSATQCSACASDYRYDPLTATCGATTKPQITCGVTNCQLSQCKGPYCLACSTGFLLNAKQNACDPIVTENSCDQTKGKFVILKNACFYCKDLDSTCTNCVAKDTVAVCTEYAKPSNCASSEMKIFTSSDSFTCVKDPTCLQFDANNNCTNCLNGSTPVLSDPNDAQSLQVCKTCPNVSAAGVCITCPDNCLFCSQDATSTFVTCKVDGCAKGFQVGPKGNCVRIPPTCDSPLTLNAATNQCACPFQSVRNSAGSCDCLTGLIWSAVQTEGCKAPAVTDCKAGYKLVNNACQACTSSFEVRNADGSIDSTQFGSEKCSACTGDVCDACRPGTYLDRTSNICRVCDVNCARCSGAGKCSLCEVGFFLNEGACKTACDTGRLPSVKSYWVSNNQLFSTISKNDILQNTAIVPTPTILTIDGCGEPLAISESTICSKHDNKLPFATSPVLVDVATNNQVTLQCIPCLNLCKACIPGLILLPDGNKCVQECPAGFTAQLDPTNNQMTCTTTIDTTVKLDIKPRLDSALADNFRGFALQNYYSNVQLFVESTITDKTLSHSIKLSGLFLLGKGDEISPVAEELLDKADLKSFATASTLISKNSKPVDNTFTVPFNTLLPNFIYKVTINTASLNKDGTTDQKVSKNFFFAVIPIETTVPLDEKTAKVFLSFDSVYTRSQVCANLVINDIVSYNKNTRHTVTIGYKQAYVNNIQTMAPSKTFKSLIENVYCFIAPYVEVETVYSVTFTLSFNGVNKIAEKLVQVLPQEKIDPTATTSYNIVKKLSTSTTPTTTNQNLLQTSEYIDLVSIITVKTETTTNTSPATVQTTDASTNTVNSDVFCKVGDTASCNNNGTCVQSGTKTVCKCNTGFDVVTNCQTQWTADQTKQINESNTQLLEVLTALNNQKAATSSTSTTTTTTSSTDDSTTISSSTTVELVSKILTTPITNTDLLLQSIKAISSVESNANFDIQKCIQALSLAQNTLVKLQQSSLLNTTPGGRMLAETAINQQNVEVQQQIDSTIRKVLDKLSNELPDSQNSADLTSTAYNLKVTKVPTFSDDKLQMFQQDIALIGDNGKPATINVPTSLFAGDTNPIIRSYTKGDLSDAVINDVGFQVYGTPFELEITTGTGASRRVLDLKAVKDLVEPIEIKPDISNIPKDQPIKCMFLDTLTNQWSSQGVMWNNDIKSCTTTHLSTFAVGTSDTEIAPPGDGNKPATPTDNTQTNTTNTNPQPETVAVNAPIFSAFAFCLFVVVNFVIFF